MLSQLSQLVSLGKVSQDENEKLENKLKVVKGPASLGNTRSRGWCGTWNNYSEKDYSDILEWCIMSKFEYIIGKEKGELSQLSHLQFYFYSKNQIKFKTLKKMWTKVHWEKAKGSKKQNLLYCSKENDFVTNIKIKENFNEKLINMIIDDEYKDIVWKDWQNEILDLIKSKPRDRKIYWFWDKIGNIGKSFLAKYICMKNKVVIADGKKDNVLYQIKAMLEEKEIPKIIILDIPRSCLNYVNYGIIEQLKNGFGYSGKYKGGVFFIPVPHVLVFANKQPEYDEMSLDRWIVKELV